MSKPIFIQFETPDNLTLPGLLYPVEGSKKVAIFLHGNGSSSVFYDTDTTLIDALNEKGISYLSFNNRGAHLIKKLNVKNPDGTVERKRYGMAYEKIKECVEDIDGAIAFLEKQGYEEFYLVGESTGANKICNYSFYKPENKISKYILLSGGDDTGVYYDVLGVEKFNRLLQESKDKIAKGEGEQLVCELQPDEIFSYIGFCDIANPDGDYNTFPFNEALNNIKLSTKPLFRHFKSINKPSLVVYGAQDEYCYGKVPEIVEILKKIQPTLTYTVIEGADHGFEGKEKELGKVVAEWLIS
jgi:pimeloyl-ACP methyl ester carboxylesterase